MTPSCCATARAPPPDSSTWTLAKTTFSASRAMRAREACGVTTRRGGEGTREATGRVEASRDASARTRYQGDWLDVGEVCGKGKTIEDYVSRWRAGPFEPYGGRRKDCAYAVCGAEDATRRGAAALMREISREYELCGLGKHEPMVEG